MPPKTWKIPGKHGKSREGMGNPGKAWEIPARHRKSRQGIGNPGKAWKILGKHGRCQEFRESTGNPSPGSAVKTRKIPGFFSRWDLQWAYFSKSLKNNKKAWKITGKMVNTGKALNCPGNPGQELLVINKRPLSPINNQVILDDNILIFKLVSSIKCTFQL